MKRFQSQKQVSEFYNEVKKPLYGYLLKRTGNDSDAADLFQDCFAQFVQWQSRLDRRTAKAWLFAVAKNRLIKLWEARSNKQRHEAPKNEQQEEQWQSALPKPDEVLVNKEELQLLSSLLKQLDAESRDLLLMHYTGGLSMKNIAAITGFSEANLRVKMHRIRGKMNTLHRGLYKEFLNERQ